MTLSRILVDGYSLLHNWPDLAPGQPRHSARARDELVHVLTRYQDATGERITIFLMAPASRVDRQMNPARRLRFCFRAPARLRIR